MNRIYYLEDDADIRCLVVYTLNATGFEARGFERADEFMAALAGSTPDLILLDVMLPGISGLDILRRLKEDGKTMRIPVVMITALNAEDDKVNALELGADDYIAKPFGVMEMLARVRAVLRRCADLTHESILRSGSICMDESCHDVTIGGERIQLTLKEYELLRVLMVHAGRLVEREKLIAQAWNGSQIDANHTLDAHMRTLRTKLGEAGGCIQTVYGRGYRLNANTK